MPIRSDLCKVMLYVQKTTKEITCGKPKVEVKQSINKRTACNSRNPYEINPGEQEVSIEIPDVSQAQRSIFSAIMKRQTTGKMLHAPSLAIYKYDSKGKIVLDYHLKGVWIESISQEGNEPFDVKGGAYTPEKL